MKIYKRVKNNNEWDYEQIAQSPERIIITLSSGEKFEIYEKHESLIILKNGIEKMSL